MHAAGACLFAEINFTFMQLSHALPGGWTQALAYRHAYTYQAILLQTIGSTWSSL
jgi:hypothetical protein